MKGVKTPLVLKFVHSYCKTVKINLSGASMDVLVKYFLRGDIHKIFLDYQNFHTIFFLYEYLLFAITFLYPHCTCDQAVSMQVLLSGITSELLLFLMIQIKFVPFNTILSWRVKIKLNFHYV
jgi:hypothetical protein